MKVFISSTSLDLKTARRKVAQALRKAGHEPVGMEDWGARHATPLEEALRKVAESDVFVGIYAWRYGFRPPNQNLSITELEYDEAGRRDIPRFAFVLRDNARWPANRRDCGEDEKCIRNLRARVLLERCCESWTTADELATGVVVAVGQGSSPPGPPSGPPAFPIPVDERFKDRVDELARLQQYLSDPAIRAILICGRAGTGKTQLVAKLFDCLRVQAADMCDGGHIQVDDVVFLNLGDPDSRSPDWIVDRVRRKLDPAYAREHPNPSDTEGGPLRDRIGRLFRETLRLRRCVIVFDNLESVLDDDNHIREEHSELRLFVEEMLQQEHSALLIATSRKDLAMSSLDLEVSVFGRKALIPLDEGLPVGEAVADLRDSDPDGSRGVRGAQEAVLAQIARQCGCVPRTLRSVVGVLSNRNWTLDTLLDNPETLERIIDKPELELYSSLQPTAERLVVQAIAVVQQFEETVSRAAIGYILPVVAADEVLARLVHNHVATQLPDTRIFALHPAFLNVTYNQMDEGDRRRMHSLAARFYGTLARPRCEWSTIEDLRPQIRQFRHLVCAGLYDDACALLNTFDRDHLALWGYQQLVIELREQLVDHTRDPLQTALNLGNLGAASSEAGDAPGALAVYDKVITLFRELGNREQEGRFIGNRGVAKQQEGDVAGAEEDLVNGLAIAKEIGDKIHVCRWLGKLAVLRLGLGRTSTEVATRDLKEAIRCADESGDQKFKAIWTTTLGRILVNSQSPADRDEAVRWLSEAVTVAAQIHDIRNQCIAILELAALYRGLGRSEEENRCLGQVRATLEKCSRLEDRCDILLWIGYHYESREQTQEAVRYYEEAMAVARSLSAYPSQVQILNRLAPLYASAGQLGRSAEEWKTLAGAALADGNHAAAAQALANRAEALMKAHRISECVITYKEVLQLSQEHGLRAQEIDSAYRLAVIYRDVNDPSEAMKYYEMILPSVERLGNLYGQLRILNEMGIAHYQLRAFADAVEYYERSLEVARAVDDYEGISVALFNIGDAYDANGEPAKAISYYEDVLARRCDGIRHKCLSILGVAYAQLSDLQSARVSFERCIALCDKVAAEANNLCPYFAARGLSLLGLGKQREALEAFREGLAADATPEGVGYMLDDVLRLDRAPVPIPGIEAVRELLTAKLRELQPE